jgi:hypothetical protein
MARFRKAVGGDRFKTRCFNQILCPIYIVNIYNKAIAIFDIDIFIKKDL